MNGLHKNAEMPLAASSPGDAVNGCVSDAMNLLTVDDQQQELELLKVPLNAEGYRIIETNDGIEALQVLETRAVDSIISANLMPRMEGCRLCGEARKSSRWQNLPLIVYTAAYTSPAGEKLALDLGADACPARSASPARLLEVLRKAANLEQRDAAQAPR